MINDSIHVWHVAKTGNDANSGHAGQYPVNLTADAKLTIGATITAAAAGDTIVVWPGTYVENVVISKSLTLLGFGVGKTIVQVSAGRAIEFTASDCVLKGFSGITTATGIVYGIFFGNVNQNIRVENCYGEGDYDGIHMGDSDNLWLINSHGKGKFDGIQAGGGDNRRVINCFGETDGSNTIDAEVQAFTSTGGKGLYIENLICVGTRALNGDLKHLYGCTIEHGAVVNGLFVDVRHTGTGNHKTKGLFIDTAATVLISNAVIYAETDNGNLYGVHVQSGQGKIDNLLANVNMDAGTGRFVYGAVVDDTTDNLINLTRSTITTALNIPTLSSVVTAQVAGSLKTKFVDSANPVPDVAPTGTYDGMILTWMSGNNQGETDTVLLWDTVLNEFSFTTGFTNDIQMGDTYDLDILGKPTEYSLYNSGSNGTLEVVNTEYETSKAFGVINNISPQADASGRVDLGAINGNTTAASNLEKSAGSMKTGTVDTATFTPTASQFEADDITDAAADHYNGRIVLFTSGSLIRQAAQIIDYALSGANGKFTVSGLTAAPANNDTFIIV